MSDWWLDLLGIDYADLPEGATTEFVWTHAPQSWGVFVVIAVALALLWGVFYFYRRENASCPRGIRVGLGFVRAAVLVLLLIVAMGPALAVSTERIIEPLIIVLLDESLSMSLEDRYYDEQASAQIAEALDVDQADLRADGLARASVIDQVLQRDDAQLVRSLTARGKLRVLSFADSVKQRQIIGFAETAPEEGEGGDATTGAEDSGEPALEQGQPLPPLNPTGTSTDMAKAIREGMRIASGNPIAAIVLMGDGRNTEGDDPRSAAAEARRRGVPIMTVGIGDPSPTRNVRVAQIWAPDRVFKADPFILQTQITSNGIEIGGVEVQLKARRINTSGEPGAETVIETQRINLTGDGEQRLRFEYKPEEPGDYIFTVHVAEQPGEVIATDNDRSIPIKVLSDQARVLLIAGGPSWEYRMVTQLLKRDKTIDLSCWLQTMDLDMAQDGNTVIDRLPDTPAALFEYDVVMMLDPDPEAFDEAWIEALKKFLSEHAGGLLWVAGPQHTARFMTQFRTRDMRDLLPVYIDELSQMDVASLVATYTRPWPLKVTAAGADHALLRLDAEPQVNRRAWQEMPGLYWSFQARSAKPAAQVLAEHSDPRLRTRDGARPLLVVGQYGPGRTAYMGFNGTWRWRKTGEKYFDQYWIQVVRYLVEGRLLGGRKRGQISTDREVYPIGSRVRVEARLFDPTYQPLTEPTVEALMRGPGGRDQAVQLRPVANRDGYYEGSLIANETGLNELVITLPGRDLVRLSKQFTVEVPRVELAETQLDEAMLRDIAQQSGGTYFALGQLDLMPAAITRPPETIVIKGRPIELWDTNRLLILLVVLLTAEWALRKRFRLL